MKYIEEKEVLVMKRVCTHPKVKKFWEYGGMSSFEVGSKAVHTACVLFYDGTLREFSIVYDSNEKDRDIDKEVVNQVEEYLNSIPC